MSRHVLAVRQDNNGDVLLTGPALRAIRAGATRLTLLCGPRGAAAARTLPGVDATIVAEAAWIDAHPAPVDRRGMNELVDRLAAQAFDEAIVFTSFHQSPLPIALLLRMAGVPRIGAISVDYPGSLLDVRHRVDDDIHEVERALSLARACGYDLAAGDDGRLRMLFAHANAPAIAQPYIVVHPGSTVPARMWAPEKNRALVARLHALGLRVAITGGREERELVRFVIGETPGVIDLCGATDFAGLAAVIARAQAIVVGNTGAAHVAAAVGTPTVSLFPPTIPASRFRPYAVPHVLLGDQDIACRGCRARACPIPDQPCLDVVTVDDVLDALATLGALAPRLEVTA